MRTMYDIRWAAELAAIYVGVTEQGGNNRGPWIEHFRANDGTGGRTGGSGAWCGVLVSFAAKAAGLQVEPSRGAKRLTRNFIAAGYIDAPVHKGELRADLLDLTRGGVICWHRGITQSNGEVRLRDRWKGHIGFIENYDRTTDTMVTIEGNKRGAVRRVTYLNGTWRKRVYKVVGHV